MITKQDKKFIAAWILNGKSGKNIELELIYKASKDGYKAIDFHSKCDGKGPTLVIILANKRLFGGYTTQAWNSSSPTGFKEDANAFTFSLTLKVKCPIQRDKKQFAVKHMKNLTNIPVKAQKTHAGSRGFT